MYHFMQRRTQTSSAGTPLVSLPNDKSSPCKSPAAVLRPVSSTLLRPVANFLLVLALALAVVQPCLGGGGSYNFTNTGSLATARSYHTATLLPDGRVLAAGISNDGLTGFTSAEIYDPATGI
jgi:hypothetical protein